MGYKKLEKKDFLAMAVFLILLGIFFVESIESSGNYVIAGLGVLVAIGGFVFAALRF